MCSMVWQYTQCCGCLHIYGPKFDYIAGFHRVGKQQSFVVPTPARPRNSGAFNVLIFKSIAKGPALLGQIFKSLLKAPASKVGRSKPGAAPVNTPIVVYTGQYWSIEILSSRLNIFSGQLEIMVVSWLIDYGRLQTLNSVAICSSDCFHILHSVETTNLLKLVVWSFGVFARGWSFDRVPGSDVISSSRCLAILSGFFSPIGMFVYESSVLRP